jgi:hypothetical protein
VEVPIPIVFRLFHLGRAYDFQAVKLILRLMQAHIADTKSFLIVSE